VLFDIMAEKRTARCDAQFQGKSGLDLFLFIDGLIFASKCPTKLVLKHSNGEQLSHPEFAT